MQKYRAAYTARALMTLVSEGTAPPPGAEERRVVCLVDRLMEPLVRYQWQELLDQPSASEEEASLVHSIPFVPRPIERAQGKKMQPSTSQELKQLE